MLGFARVTGNGMMCRDIGFLVNSLLAGWLERVVFRANFEMSQYSSTRKSFYFKCCTYVLWRLSLLLMWLRLHLRNRRHLPPQRH